MSPELAKLCDFYSEFNQAALWRLSELYTEDCFFKDPVHEVKGLDSLKPYFDRMSASLTSCKFEFHSTIQQEESAFLSWTMHFSHPRLAGGSLQALDGSTELRFAGGKVSYHRDYYDLGAMLYEQLPLLGRLIQFIKSRIA